MPLKRDEEELKRVQQERLHGSMKCSKDPTLGWKEKSGENRAKHLPEVSQRSRNRLEKELDSKRTEHLAEMCQRLEMRLAEELKDTRQQRLDQVRERPRENDNAATKNALTTATRIRREWPGGDRKG